MFEFSVIRKYLVPQKRQLSVALIASMSIGVIALVVWLVLVFLSVTGGIEKNWLEKLTSLNAPLRLNPTPAYYSSYYYLVDENSFSSGYTPKTIRQKALSDQSDPYDPTSDPELPPYYPSPHKDAQGNLVDPVKIAYGVLKDLKKEDPTLCFQDYEISGAMLKLELNHAKKSQTVLSQASYILSLSDQSPFMKSLILKPSLKDINHLFFLSNLTQNSPSHVLNNLHVKQLKTSKAIWEIPFDLLPENISFFALAFTKNGKITHLTLPQNEKSPSGLMTTGYLTRDGSNLRFNGEVLSSSTPLLTQEDLLFEAQPLNQKPLFRVTSLLQNKRLSGDISMDGLEVTEADIRQEFEKLPAYCPPWAYSVGDRFVLPQLEGRQRGVLLAKNFQDSGVLIGDKGCLCYEIATAGSLQEQRLPIYVAGFYDPGIMSVGNRCVLVDSDIASLINSSTHNQYLEKTLSTGIHVWFKNIQQSREVSAKISKAFAKHGIDKYWKITTYEEYDFAKDLLEQFRSDRYLFTLVGLIILVVACCNIISMLVILVNDKKKEIAILQSMGASKKSISYIFGACGALVGIFSSLLGVGAAVLTLQNLNSLVYLLSFFQGHDAFNAAFFGQSLPNELSSSALVIILISTPIISFLAGLVPAIKACRLNPSEILRS